MKASIKLLVVSLLFAGFLTISKNSVAAINDPCRQACDDQYASCLVAPHEQYDMCTLMQKMIIRTVLQRHMMPAVNVTTIVVLVAVKLFVINFATML